VAEPITADSTLPASKVVIDQNGDYGDDRVEITRVK